jgi:glycosyltransferase involved in cell wall biosynthesis
MKIAYITINNPFNYRSWSGLNYNIFKCLKYSGNNIDCIGPLNRSMKLIYIPKRYIFNLFKIKFDVDRQIVLSKEYSSQVQKKIFNKKYDLILTSDTTTVSYLKTETPIVLWLDTSFQSWYNHYYSNLKISKKSLREGNICEQNAINKSQRILVTSVWAKKEILKFYKCNPNKIKILPFGSNLEYNFSLSKILKTKFKSSKKVCEIVSIGVDWKRKGFDRTIKICKLLKSKGLNISLKLIGAKSSKNLPKWVKVYNFLDKNIKSTHKIISKILIKSDFHVLMTKSEAYGVVFVEASSNGVFNIAPDIGGIRGAIKNNINGKLFNVKSTNIEIANYIFKSYTNKKNLKKKIISSKLFYEKNLDWKIIGKKFNSINKDLYNLKKIK